MARDVFKCLLASIIKEDKQGVLLGLSDEYLDKDEAEIVSWIASFIGEHQCFPSKDLLNKKFQLELPDTKDPYSAYANEFYLFEKNYIKSNAIRKANGALLSGNYEESDRFLNEADLLIKKLEAAVIGNKEPDGKELLNSLLSELRADPFGTGNKGVPTGWTVLDRFGLQKGDLNTVVARPGTGKTYVLLKMAYEAWKAGHKVLFISLEVTLENARSRLLGIETGINPRLINGHKLSTRAKELIEKSAVIPSDRFKFCGATSVQKTSDVLREYDKYKPDVIYIDASYFLSPVGIRLSSANKREVTSALVTELKKIAITKNIPIVQSMQFNREAKRATKASKNNPLIGIDLIHIAEADTVGQISSVVIALSKPAETYSDQETLFMGVIKGREGERGSWVINYKFNPVNMDFIEEIDESGATAANPEDEEDVTTDDLANFD